MGRKSKSKTPKAEVQLTLEEVLKLGGTKEDYESLKDLQDGVSSKTEKVKDTLKDDEFKTFFNSVGFDKLDMSSDDENDEVQKSVTKITKSKKTKLTDLKKTSQKGDAEKDPRKKERKRPLHVDEERRKKSPEALPLQDSAISSTTEEAHVLESTPSSKRLPKTYHHVIEHAKITPKKTICKPAGPWHAGDIAKLASGPSCFELNDPLVANLRSIGQMLLQNEANVYRNDKKRDGSNDAWMKTVVTAGTLSDKVAAFTLKLQNAPIHNYQCLDTFVNMLKKKGKREALVGLEALRDIFLAELLPDNRRLRFFHQQPLETVKDIFEKEKGGAMTKRIEIQKHLIHWAYEEHLKTSYKQVVESLRDFFLQDSVDALKTKGMKVALELLKSKPEQERELLTMLVNKLGDPKYKIASKALHMLHCLIQEHPLMQGVVVGAVRDLLLRPNVQPKCQYYCICFLSAQILSHDRKDVADLLIQIYLGFFKAAIKKKQVDNKLLSAILTGVNRAYPFANTDDEKIMEELNVLYRTVHVSSFGTTVQALMLLFQVLSSRDELSDRYYNALYSSLLHPELPICSNRHPMYLNLLFRSLKSDPSESRVKAFVKRLLQTCTLQAASYTSAVLVLITELIRIKPSLKSIFENRKVMSKTDDKGQDKFSSVDDDDEEHFVDADKKEFPEGSDTVADSANKSFGKSWTHLHKESCGLHSSIYDPLHRNATYANADKTSLWELHSIKHHFHPTVVKFATELCDSNKSGVPDRYPGDPLQDFSLMRFLDKFVYRNPKARQEKDASANVGESIFRRKRKLNMSDTNAVAANTPEFLAKKSYSPEEIFLQRYFASKAGIPQQQKVKKVEDEGSDIEEVSDDEFDNFLASTEGKAQLESEYNFAEGVGAPSKNKTKMDDIDDSDEDGEDDEVDFGDFDDDFGDTGNDFEDAGEDPFSEEGMTFDDADESDEPPPKIKKKQNKKKSRSDAEAFGMMLEENTHSKIVSSGSASVRNTDRSSAKQLHWERKKESKEIIARKRAQKRFSKNKKGSKFSGKKNVKYSGKKKFRKM